MLLKSGKLSEAKTWMLKALALFDGDKMYDKGKDEMMLIQAKYLTAMANIEYISGRHREAKGYVE